MNAIQRMNYENTLLFIARSSYASASTLALADAHGHDPRELNMAHNRVKKRLCKALDAGRCAGYSKKNGLKVYGLTLKGASYLNGLGHDVRATYKQAYDAKHVYHRLCADAFCLALLKYYSKATADAGLKVSACLERDCLRLSDTFKMHFNKVPDAAFLVGKNLCWIEVDTARKKQTDMARLLGFVKHGMCIDDDSLAVKDLGNPQVLLWVCSLAAARDAVKKLQGSMSVTAKKLASGIVQITVDSGSIQRDVILCTFDFNSVSDLHERIFRQYQAALAASCPVQL